MNEIKMQKEKKKIIISIAFSSIIGNTGNTTLRTREVI